MELITLLIGTVLVNNVVLVKFLGLCPLMGVSNKFSTATGMGLATTFVLTLSCVSSWLMEYYLLEPLGLQFLRIISFILVVAAVVQFTEMMVKKSSPLLHQTLGIFLPLITTNCAVLGVALLNVQEGLNFIESVVYGFGASIGFSMVLIIFAGLRERLALSDVPATFAGTPVGLVTAGLLSMIFMGFGGLV
ncbi:electron transport complex subunit A [Marinobacterium zhoushanense]|uniref:Ion-translocating oxidoreductase complex subunit A n=1 Tax=Marinobacterium zhoushanense TaxID=1679163 RepID=A0ABQ1KM28_9GAMM|nr:electron transport complex subunit RsxA [Marinobacterium zhoushanense]GGC00440.1 electron transport complex subunit A [Marinobacterium zhoushanense]